MDIGKFTELLPLIISLIGGFILGMILIFKRTYSHIKPLIEVISGKEPLDHAAIIRIVFFLDLFVALCLWFRSIGAWDYTF